VSFILAYDLIGRVALGVAEDLGVELLWRNPLQKLLKKDR